MNEIKLRNMATLYRGMTAEEVEAHEDWVRRFKASPEGKAAAAAREAARVQRERAAVVSAMTDEEVISEAVVIALCGDGPGAALGFLREAGFERNA